jgi:hypothetical protein
MSQVDFVIYIPLLFWFVILFIIFYILMYIYIIPLLYSTLKVKRLFFDYLIENLCISNLFLEVYFYIYNKNIYFCINKFLKNTFFLKEFHNYIYIWKLIK